MNRLTQRKPRGFEYVDGRFVFSNGDWFARISPGEKGMDDGADRWDFLITWKGHEQVSGTSRSLMAAERACVAVAGRR